MKLKRNIALSESGFVFDPSTGESYTLNEQGLEIMELVRDGKTDEQIKQFLLDEYEIEENAADRYLYDFSVMLKQFRLLEDEGEN